MQEGLRGAIPIANVSGIPVKLHITFLLFLAFILMSNTARFGLAGGFVSTSFVVALFLSVTLHELGHSLVARNLGVKVRDIILLPIGGVSQLEKVPERPEDEFKIAIAGPLVSLGLGLVIFISLKLGGRSTGMISSFTGSLFGKSFWASLMSANFILGLFNLLPAFPMDGGRILRAFLATRMAYPGATRIAAWVGQGFAVLMAMFGMFLNPWLLILALFLYMGAGREEHVAEMRSVLRGIPVSRVTSTMVEYISPDAPLSTVIEHVYRGCQEDFPIVEGGEVKGILTKAGIVGALHQYGPDVAVSRVMRTDFQWVGPNDMLVDVYEKMEGCGCPSLPVVENGKLVGMVTLENIGRFFLFESARHRRHEGGKLEPKA